MWVNSRMAWFRRNRDEENMDPQVLLAKAEAVTGTGFRLTVSDVFSIAGRGTVVTGLVELGSVSKGATVLLTRADGSTRDVTVKGVELFRKIVDTATQGDNVGLLLERVERSDIGAGDVLSS